MHGRVEERSVAVRDLPGACCASNTPARRSASAAGASPSDRQGRRGNRLRNLLGRHRAGRPTPADLEPRPLDDRERQPPPRDASLGEDACRVRHAPANNAIVNNIAIARHRGFRFLPEALDHFSMRREDAFDAVGLLRALLGQKSGLHGRFGLITAQCDCPVKPVSRFSRSSPWRSSSCVCYGGPHMAGCAVLARRPDRLVDSNDH